jgi:hypothetical protein
MIVVDRSHVTELLTAPEEYIPFSEAFADFGFEYMFTGNILVNYHNRIILGPLTHNASTYSLILDEIEYALAAELGHVDSSCEIPVISSLTQGYRSVAIHNTSTRIVARLDSRVFVGLPTCIISYSRRDRLILQAEMKSI